MRFKDKRKWEGRRGSLGEPMPGERRVEGRRQKRKRKEKEERHTGGKQSISFLPSYSPRQLPQLRVLVRNIQLILLSISLPSQSYVPAPIASDTHPQA